VPEFSADKKRPNAIFNSNCHVPTKSVKKKSRLNVLHQDCSGQKLTLLLYILTKNNHTLPGNCKMIKEVKIHESQFTVISQVTKIEILNDNLKNKNLLDE